MNSKLINKKRELVIEYVKNNPHCTYKDIKNNLKIKLERINWKMGDVFRNANLPPSKNLKKRSLVKQKEDVIEFIKDNPESTVTEIQSKTKINVPRTFGSILDAYKAANIEYAEKDSKDGVRNPKVVARCHKYELDVINCLSKIGKVYPKVRTKTGIADCLFKYKNKNYVVEVKDFRSRNNITMSQIKQLINYMQELEIKNGILICPKESFPKRKNGRSIQKRGLRINIISKEEINEKWGHWDSNF
jgi:hypothetical protein